MAAVLDPFDGVPLTGLPQEAQDVPLAHLPADVPTDRSKP
jgi:hypothetical protein